MHLGVENRPSRGPKEDFVWWGFQELEKNRTKRNGKDLEVGGFGRIVCKEKKTQRM